MMTDKPVKAPAGVEIGRRTMLLVAATLGVTAATVTATSQGVDGRAAKGGKRASRYQANSAEVQTYYRVNAYPAR